MPNTVYVGGRVLVGDGATTPANAVVLREGRVAAVGTRDAMVRIAGRGAEQVDVHGATILPGLVDTHPHLMHFGTFAEPLVDIADARSHDDIVEIIRARAADTPAGEWIMTTPRPTIRSVRAYPADQRFEPQFPGNTFFVTEYHMAGDPLLTWGNFKLVGKGPLLAGASHCADLDQPNWMHRTCGGKSGVKYWRTRMELVPELYVVEMEPTSYPRAPISKKRIWFDARTLYPMTMISYDRQGKIWKQWEGGSDYYERKPGMKWFEGTPDHFVSWSHVHAHDLQSNRMSRFYCAQTVPGGYHATVDDPGLFDN